MNSGSGLFAAMAMCAIITGPLQTRADQAYGVNPGVSWNGYISVFELDDMYVVSFDAPTSDLRASVAPAPANELTLALNTVFHIPSDPFWVDQTTGLPNKIIEAEMYQLGAAAPGEIISFDWQVVANSLPVGYEARAFINQLTANYAFLDQTSVDLTVGTPDNLSISVGPATGLVLVGFSIKGVAVSPTSPEAQTSVTIIPEPTTFTLVGLGSLALVMVRRQR